MNITGERKLLLLCPSLPSFVHHHHLYPLLLISLVNSAWEGIVIFSKRVDADNCHADDRLMRFAENEHRPRSSKGKNNAVYLSVIIPQIFATRERIDRRCGIYSFWNGRKWSETAYSRTLPF